MRLLQQLALSLLVAVPIAQSAGAEPGDNAPGAKSYRFVDGEVDAGTYNGFRRYHASCNHCHGPDGMGSTIAPPLIDRLPDKDAFRQAVDGGVANGVSVMKGFADDPNIAPYVDDIYAYLQARADGVLPRGRPVQSGH